jgi:hypothetical protein
MSLHDEIFSWVKRQPAWKQELYLRAAAKPELEPREIEEVSDILLGCGEHTPAPLEVTRDDLPGARDGGKPFRIASLSELRGVNLIADRQTLAFESNGLNVVSVTKYLRTARRDRLDQSRSPHLRRAA